MCSYIHSINELIVALTLIHEFELFNKHKQNLIGDTNYSKMTLQEFIYKNKD